MKMIRAVIRPEKVSQVLSELADADYPAVTTMDVMGRGKQCGVKSKDVHYDELPKVMIMMVVEDESKEDVVRIIMKNAKTGEGGAFGDGKIFVSTILESYTVSTAQKEL